MLTAWHLQMHAWYFHLYVTVYILKHVIYHIVAKYFKKEKILKKYLNSFNMRGLVSRSLITSHLDQWEGITTV